MSDDEVKEFLKNDDNDNIKEDDDNIDELLKQLNPDAHPVNPMNELVHQTAEEENIEITDENVGDFVMQNAAKIVSNPSIIQYMIHYYFE